MGKSLITACILSIWSFAGIAQQAMNCCTKDEVTLSGPSSATETFARLSGDPVFRMYHDDPLPFTFHSRFSESVSFPTPDGGTSSALVWRAPKGNSQSWLLVFHEWWGLNDYIKKESEQLWSDLGINVMAVDLYDGKVAATRDSAIKYVQGARPERGVAIVRGALGYLGRDAKVYTIGWCYGGGWSLQASLLAGNQAYGCVMYYGMPENDENRLKALHADVLGIFANKDQGITPAVVDAFADRMKSAGKNLELHRYDAVHAFANPSNPGYNADAASDAYKFVLAFLRARL